MNSHKELQRIEAFSDGVFAIACTLLVLEFRVPHVEDGSAPGALWPALKAAWPSFVAYILSFGAILVAWAGHHRVFNLLAGSSKAFVYANGLLLLTITFIPFPTAVLAQYVNTPQANIAVMFYSMAFLALNAGFNIWWLSMFRPIRLFPASASNAAVKSATIQIFSGLPVYAGTTVISYWFPTAGLIIILGLEVLWIVMSVGSNERVMWGIEATPDTAVRR
jgi:uncharacterized membrane protein